MHVVPHIGARLAQMQQAWIVYVVHIHNNEITFECLDVHNKGRNRGPRVCRCLIVLRVGPLRQLPREGHCRVNEGKVEKILACPVQGGYVPSVAADCG